MTFDLRDYIVVIDNLIPHNLCDSIINEYSVTNEWEYSTTQGGVQLHIRNVMRILMSTSQSISVNETTRKMFDKNVYAAASQAIKKYNEKFKEAAIEEDSGYELLRYETGQFYTKHIDSFKAVSRAVSCSFGLNDDYEGGEFAFFNKEIKIKVPKGSAIMFPSNFMYPHEILPVTNGKRYSIVTWFM